MPEVYPPINPRPRGPVPPLVTRRDYGFVYDGEVFGDRGKESVVKLVERNREPQIRSSNLFMRALQRILPKR